MEDSVRRYLGGEIRKAEDEVEEGTTVIEHYRDLLNLGPKPPTQMNKAFMIHGNSGAGKSRFLLELPNRIQRACDAQQLGNKNVQYIYFTFNSTVFGLSDEFDTGHKAEQYLCLRAIHAIHGFLNYPWFEDWLKVLHDQLLEDADALTLPDLYDILNLQETPTLLLIDEAWKLGDLMPRSSKGGDKYAEAVASCVLNSCQQSHVINRRFVPVLAGVEARWITDRFTASSWEMHTFMIEPLTSHMTEKLLDDYGSIHPEFAKWRLAREFRERVADVQANPRCLIRFLTGVLKKIDHIRYHISPNAADPVTLSIFDRHKGSLSSAMDLDDRLWDLSSQVTSKEVVKAVTLSLTSPNKSTQDMVHQRILPFGEKTWGDLVWKGLVTFQNGELHFPFFCVEHWLMEVDESASSIAVNNLHGWRDIKWACEDISFICIISRFLAAKLGFMDLSLNDIDICNSDIPAYSLRNLLNLSCEDIDEYTNWPIDRMKLESYPQVIECNLEFAAGDKAEPLLFSPKATDIQSWQQLGSRPGVSKITDHYPGEDHYWDSGSVFMSRSVAAFGDIWVRLNVSVPPNGQSVPLYLVIQTNWAEDMDTTTFHPDFNERYRQIVKTFGEAVQATNAILVPLLISLSPVPPKQKGQQRYADADDLRHLPESNFKDFIVISGEKGMQSFFTSFWWEWLQTRQLFRLKDKINLGSLQRVKELVRWVGEEHKLPALSDELVETIAGRVVKEREEKGGFRSSEEVVTFVRNVVLDGSS